MVYKVIQTIICLCRAISRVNAIVRPLRSVMKSQFGLPAVYYQLFQENRSPKESPRWQKVLLGQTNERPIRKYQKRKSHKINVPWRRKFLKSAVSSTLKSPTKYKRINDKIATNGVVSSSVPKYTLLAFFGHTNQGFNPAQQAIVQTTRVVQTVRQRNKRNTESFDKLKELMHNKGRTKRDLHKQQISTNSSNHFDGFYRHPRLSYEEQKEMLEKFKGSLNNGTLKPKNMNTNSSPTLYKLIWDSINAPRHKLKTIDPPKESRKDDISVVPKCNKTANGIKLDNPKCSLAQSLNFNEQDSKDVLRSHKVLRKPKSTVDKQEKTTKGKHIDTTESRTLPTNKSYSTTSMLAKQQKKEKIYINLQDHQKNKEHNESSDIPEYNPDNIPYEEVPDYSDIREESLDEIDRQNNNSKYIKDFDSEIVDPAASTVEEEGPNQQNVNASMLRSDVSSKEKHSPSIPEVLNTNPVSKNTDEIKEFDKENRKNESTEAFESEEDAHELTKVQKDENVTTADEQIEFDINDYRKAFNLDDFINSDPIFKRLRLLTNNQKVENLSEAGDESSDDENVSEVTTKQNATSDSSDASIEEFAFVDDGENVEEKENEESYESDEAKNHKVVEKAQDDDQVFLKSIFSNKKDKKASPLSEKEAEFLSQHFTDEIIRELEDNHDSEDDTNRKSQSNEDIYKTLSTIFDKKDQVSRLNDDISEEIMDGGKVPTRYKNFWSLEYSSPKRKVDSKTKVE